MHSHPPPVQEAEHARVSAEGAGLRRGRSAESAPLQSLPPSLLHGLRPPPAPSGPPPARPARAGRHFTPHASKGGGGGGTVRRGGEGVELLRGERVPCASEHELQDAPPARRAGHPHLHLHVLPAGGVIPCHVPRHALSRPSCHIPRALSRPKTLYATIGHHRGRGAAAWRRALRHAPPLPTHGMR